MFYTKFKLFKQYFPCTPIARHPDSAAFITTIDFSGTKFSIYAPPTGYKDAFIEEVNPEASYDLSKLNVWENMELSNEDNIPSYYEIINWYWPFYGPFFTGVRSHIQMSVHLVTDANPDYKGSMFDHQVLYNALNEDWTSSSSHRYTNGHSLQLQVYSISRDGDFTLPQSSLVFNVSHMSNVTSRFIETKIGIPVADNQFILIGIENRMMNDYEGDFRENWINTANMDQYVENIISTLTVKLSNEAQAAAARIKSTPFEAINTQLK